MALKTNADSVKQNSFKQEFTHVVKNSDDSSIKANIFELANKMKNEVGDCKVIQGWADDLEAEIQKCEENIKSIRAQGSELEYISREKYLDYVSAEYAFKEMHEGDDGYMKSKDELAIKEGEYRTSRSDLTSNSNDEYSEIMTKSGKVFDLGKLKRYITLYQLFQTGN